MNDPTVFRRDCFKPNCATTLSINVTVPYASTGGKAEAAILATLIDKSMRDPVVDETLAAIRKAPHPLTRSG